MSAPRSDQPRRRTRELPEHLPTIRDPHHDQIEWTFYDRRFWQRYGSPTRWYEVKRVHLTLARIKELATLVERVQEYEYRERVAKRAAAQEK